MRYRRHALRRPKNTCTGSTRPAPCWPSGRNSTTRPTPSAKPTCSSRATTPATSATATPSRTTSSAGKPSITSSPIPRSDGNGKTKKNAVEQEARTGDAGRFGAGLPAIGDSQMLFLLTALSKMKRRKTAAAASPSSITAPPSLRRRRQRSFRNPQTHHGKRPARSHHRPAQRHLLQHWHRHLHLGTVQQKSRHETRRQNPAHRRQRPVRKTPQGAGQQTQRHPAKRHRHHHPPVRRHGQKTTSAKSSTTATSATPKSPSNAP